MATPLIGKGCDNNLISGETFGGVCSGVGYVDIDSTWKPTFVAQEGNWIFSDGMEYSGLITVDKNSKAYDAHYLVGNYYQYNTVTAGTGGILESGDAPESICPKGWRLMTSAIGDYNPEGSLYKLFRAYELANDGITSEYGSVAEIVKAPLYFSPNSVAYVWSGVISKPGNSGSYISSTAFSEDDVLKSPILNFSVSADFVWMNRHDDARQSGGNVRCLAR